MLFPSTSKKCFFFSFLDDPAPYIDGVRINSPHYLCKIGLDPTQDRK